MDHALANNPFYFILFAVIFEEYVARERTTAKPCSAAHASRMYCMFLFCIFVCRNLSYGLQDRSRCWFDKLAWTKFYYSLHFKLLVVLTFLDILITFVIIVHCVSDKKHIANYRAHDELRVSDNACLSSFLE
jgi:hypothetical protein